jgi:hypothetical protein
MTTARMRTTITTTTITITITIIMPSRTMERCSIPSAA